MKRALLFICLHLVGAGWAVAYDFSAVAPTGQTLYYNIVGNEAHLTYKNFDSINWYDYYDTVMSGTLVIPSQVMYNDTSYTVTAIGPLAFSRCIYLESVSIPNTVTKIGIQAFDGCTSLSSITIPNSVDSIGSSAFLQCLSLTNIYIPASVSYFGNSPFAWCDNLVSINVSSQNTTYDSRGSCNAIIETATNTLIAGCRQTAIPLSVTRIGHQAFWFCSGVSSITLHEGITHIYDGAFSWMRNLESVHLPSSLVYIGPAAFQGCEALASIVLPDSLSGIEELTFHECVLLNDVVIGKSVTHIGASAFERCLNLTSVTIRAETPPALDYSWITTDTILCHVPCGTAAAYMMDSMWSSLFGNFHEMCTGLATVTAIPSSESAGMTLGSGIYASGDTATLMALPKAGYTFLGWNDGTMVNPYHLVADSDTTIIALFSPGDTIYILDTMTTIDTVWLTQTDTVWLHDTVIVHDTVYITEEGVGDIETLNAKVYFSRGQIVVEGSDGNTVTLYDVTGRVLATKQDHYAPLRFDAPASGTYMIKIGKFPARKVVVVR